MNPTEINPCHVLADQARSHSATVGASGFSHSTGFPAATQARASSAWVRVV